MKWFYLKLGTGNQDVELNLNVKNPRVKIYFGTTTAEEFLIGKGDKQGQDFCESGLKVNRKQRTLVVTHQGTLWLLEPTGEVKTGRAQKYPDGTTYLPKVMPVKARKFDYCQAPAVLTEIHCSRWLGSGTFREIPDWGNVKAIEMLLERGIPSPHLKADGPNQLLECLSSVELETLVAKLFEEAGCFVEARRGGTRWGLDVVAHNDTNRTLRIEEVKIPPGGRIGLQVKRWTKLTEVPEGVDYLIGLFEDEKPSHRALNAAWILNQVRQRPASAAWLRRSLNWLPPNYLMKWGLIAESQLPVLKLEGLQGADSFLTEYGTPKS